MSAATTALREKQAPIKDGYRTDPASAVVTLKSSGSLDASSITCKLSTGAAVKEAAKVAGLHPKAGGPDPDISGELCSGDMLLDALVACSGVTLKAVATALSIPILSGTITAEGDLDFRGTLGVDRNAPVGITGIRLVFDIEFGEKEDGRPVDEAEVEKLGKLTERYCVVLQTLVNKPKLSVRVAEKGSGKEEDGNSRQIVWEHSA
ncbi:OsmC/Ohr family [Massariosphaeria phaeospora]|uniref:OsmC/Ohr family n=1 Tax=Massariosphaeria phaeospora TaxID=100035 RepID=A0A7C8M3P8_9PLEO|nr:OsmC/Ohr family [Massariosphaeria phaeospora]